LATSLSVIDVYGMVACTSQRPRARNRDSHGARRDAWKRGLVGGARTLMIAAIGMAIGLPAAWWMRAMQARRRD